MANHVFQHSGTAYNKLRRSERFNPINIEPPLKRNRNFARVRTESVPVEAPAGSGSLYPADNNSKENVNGKQRAAAAIPEVRRIEESVKTPCLQVKKTRNRRSSTSFVGKNSNKTQKPSNSTYFINTRSTQRSEIAIITWDSVSSYYTSLVNEDLVIPTKSNKKRLQKTSQITTNRTHNKSGGSTIKGKLRTERLKKVTKRPLKRKEPVCNSTRRKVRRLETVSAYEFNAAEENNISEVTEKEDSETEAEQVVPVPHKSFFERSVEGFCQIHPAFNNATQRCLNRLKLIRLTIPMNSPASPTTPAVQSPTMLSASSSTSAYQHQYMSPTTAAILAQAMTTTTATSITNSANSHSGKRKYSDDTAFYCNDHNYPINNNNHQQNTTPPGHLCAKYNHHPQPISNQSVVAANEFSLSPNSWIFQTPDKQKQSKLPPPSTVHEDDADDGYGGLVPVMLHHNKRLKTVYSFVESTFVDLVQGGGGVGGLMEVQIDSDRLAPICQISTTDDGADCEFEASSMSPNISGSSTLATTVVNGIAAEEQNQFQLQTHELSLDFSMSSGDSSNKRHRLDGFDGEIEEEGAFLDQWVRMNAGGSANQSPLRVLQHLPTSTTAPPKPLSTINHYLRTIHNEVTQRPTKTRPRFDRRQYLERKSLTFDENCSSSNNSSPGGTDTPKVGDTSRWRLRAFKEKAASDLGSARKRSMDLFNADRGETIRDLRDISATITSGAYELESGDMSHEQENIMPPSRMRLLLGNLQMNDSVDINYDRPLYPRINY